MTQIAMILPAAAPQAPPPSPSAGSDSQSFSPHLDKAIASKKDTSPTQNKGAGSANEKKTEDKSGTDTTTKNTSSTDNKSKITDKNHSAGDSKPKAATSKKDQEVVTDKPQTEDQSTAKNDIVIFMTTSATTTESMWENQNDVLATQALNKSRISSSKLFDFLSQNTASSDDASGQPLALPEQSGENTANESLLSSLIAKTLGISTTNSGTSETSAESAETKTGISALTQQLEKIIAAGNESGKVTITVTSDKASAQTGVNNPQAAMPQISSPTDILAQSINSTKIPGVIQENSPIASAKISGEQNSQDIPSLRHSLRQQYFDGQFALQNKNESNTSTEGGQQSKTFASKGTQLQEQSSISSLSADQSNSFAQPLSLLQEGQKSLTANGLPPVTLPSGTVVRQEEVIRQIAEHFQIARRDNDTKVNIQLHPAELGELKIGLSVKEGSVHANVVASTQYAQEIIEKNMSKLRTVLESQGFTVGEMSITCKSDTASDFNLFERQLFSKNDYTPPSTKQTHTPGSLFTMDGLSSQEQPSVSGVNVTI